LLHVVADPLAGNDDPAAGIAANDRCSGLPRRKRRRRPTASKTTRVVLQHARRNPTSHRPCADFTGWTSKLDLFGAWCFICEWGRIGQPGQLRMSPTPHRRTPRPGPPAPSRHAEKGLQDS
jgi:hypothetical protein